MIDLTTEFGQRVKERLENETVMWLTTTGRSHIPQPRPIWFYWNGKSILIYTSPAGAKVSHIRQNPVVALHFNSDARGRDIVVLHGDAILPDAVSDSDHAGYMAKYGELIKGTGMDMDKNQHQPGASIIVTPTKLRGF